MINRALARAEGAKAIQAVGGRDNLGERFAAPYMSKSGKIYDTSGAFLIGQLSEYDPTPHLPLFSYKFTRDLPLRPLNIWAANTEFLQQSFALSAGTGLGTPAPGMKRNFIGMASNQPEEIMLDAAAVTVPTEPWAAGLSYNVFELEQAARLGMALDQAKMVALDAEYMLQSDAQAYLGWQTSANAALNTYGLLNQPLATQTNLPNGASGTTGWLYKTATEIVTDLVNMIYTPYLNSGYAVVPNRIGLDPLSLSIIAARQISVSAGTASSTAGSTSIMNYFLSSNIANIVGDGIQFVDMKYATGRGVGGTNRAVVYRYEPNWQSAPIRFPWMETIPTPLQYDGIAQRFYKVAKMGGVELVYPSLLAYFDGL
jgi:hypothetical protein